MPNTGDIFSHDDLNTNKTIWENLKDHYKLKPQLPFYILGDVDKNLFKYIMYSMKLLTMGSISWKGSEQYYGICFNYNPSIEGKFYQYSQYYESDNRLLSYENTLGFYEYNPVGYAFSELFHPFYPVRSKIATLMGGEFIGDWHTDEDPRECVKVLIPVKTDESHMIQIEGKEPFHIPLGKALVFDASVPHRIICNDRNSDIRHYLVFSLPIWWKVSKKGIECTDFINMSIPEAFIYNTNFFIRD